MATLTVARKGPSLFAFDFYPDPDNPKKKKSLSFKDDKASIDVPAGKHLLVWVVQGKVGAEFSYTVKLDDTTVEDVTAKVSPAKWETGGILLKVNS